MSCGASVSAELDRLVDDGNALLARGDAAGAASRYRAALSADPAHGRARFNLGVACQALGQRDEALRCFEQVAASDPRSTRALVNWANLLRESGDLERAGDLYVRALSIDPQDPHALNNLGQIAKARGELEEAWRYLTRAVASGNPAARLPLGQVLHDLGRLADACDQLQSVVEDAPTADSHHSLALVLAAQKRHEEALVHYDAALALEAARDQAMVDRGDALLALERLDEAQAAYRAALDANPGNAQGWNNLGALLVRLGNAHEARRCFETASRDSGYRGAQYNAGIMALILHDFAFGWDQYEKRFDDPAPLGTMVPTDLPEPPLDFAGVRRLAVRKEQGIGDQILFSTLLPEILERSVQAVVEVDARLVSAYRRGFPDVQFVTSSKEALDAFAACDHQVPLASLPRYFRRDAGAFRAQPDSLFGADPRRVEDLRGRMPPRPRVGISWRSVRGDRVAQSKTLPLESFALLPAEIALVDLQYGPAEDERQRFDAAHPGRRHELDIDLFNDLEGLLAAISLCDAVVTGSNVTAHLAGALGKRTLLVYVGVLPPFHYWSRGRDGRSLWYPSVEVFNRPSWASADEAFDALARHLADEL